MNTRYFLSRLEKMNPQAKMRLHERFGNPVGKTTAMKEKIILSEEKGPDLTVGKTVPFLRHFDPESIVTDEKGNPILFVNAAQGEPDSIWLQTEQDVDMKEELRARFEHAVEDQVDETEFYQELLNTGITPYVVRKYLGEKTANHINCYCKNHGLL